MYSDVDERKQLRKFVVTKNELLSMFKESPRMVFMELRLRVSAQASQADIKDVGLSRPGIKVPVRRLVVYQDPLKKILR